MSARTARPRAAIVVTGTEVLDGIIADRNGPWLSERLRESGLELATTTVVADRRDDVLAVLRFLAAEGIDVVITTGGLGPTADDLTVEVVAEFAGRRLRLDTRLEQVIHDILRPLAHRWPGLDMDAIMASNRKQAMIPEGATVIDPVGTAPGLVVPPAPDAAGPTIVVLPGPPRELAPMWSVALETPAMGTVLARAAPVHQEIMRLFGIPESELAAMLRELERDGLPLGPLEITTCLRRGEIEIATRFHPDDAAAYEMLRAAIRERQGATLFSEDGSTIDDQVAELLQGWTVATAESCTGGLLAARLTERPGASAHVLGGLVCYSNGAKTALAGVDPEILEEHGAVSEPVALELARGAIAALGAAVGVGITGIAGPSGGTAEKPVGRVCVAVTTGTGSSLVRSVDLPGSRQDIRERTTVVAMHLLRRVLQGSRDDPLPAAAPAADR